MRVAIIGRSEVMLESAAKVVEAGHEIALVITSKEAPEYLVGTSDFEAFAAAHEAPFIRTARIGETRDRIRALPPIDVAVSVNYAGVIPADIIDLFRLGILNAHGGDLPRYRGNACQAWAILNGEPHIGLCVHSMVGGELDSGDIIAYDQIELTPSTGITDVWAWLKARIPGLFVEALTALRADPAYRLRAQADDPRPPLRCYPRRPEDGRIDWSKPAAMIFRLILASGRPYAGAFCRLEGETLTVWSAGPVNDGEQFLAIPGQITAIGPGWVHVATGSGKIALTSVGLGGRNATPDCFISSLRTRLS